MSEPIIADIERKQHKLVMRIKQIVDDEYFKKLTVEEIAAKINYSGKQTQRIFLKETGKTIHEYVTEFRIQKAKEMLCEQDCKIYILAEQIGYKNTTHFKKVFKKHTGQTPAEYKKHHRTKKNKNIQ